MEGFQGLEALPRMPCLDILGGVGQFILLTQKPKGVQVAQAGKKKKKKVKG